MPTPSRATVHEKHDPELVAGLGRMATRMRRQVLQMTSAAGSGHPTSSLSAADLVAALFFHALRYDVVRPDDPHNDRFVLSKGHGAPILYAALAEAGAFPAAALADLRRFGSDLEGHPTPRLPWVDVATGSLGLGLSNGVGMAIAARMDGLAARVWVLMGDGETAEGAVWEAVQLAAHRGLDNLVGIVDVNRLAQSDPTMLGWDLDGHARRFDAFGWHTIVIDGHDFDAILAAYDEAVESHGRPTAILARTVKGKGVGFLEDAEGWHGRPLAAGDERERGLADVGTPPAGPALRMRRPPPGRRAYPGPEPTRPPGIEPPAYQLGEEVATRTAYGTALAKLGAVEPRVVALDGDVKNSTGAGKFAEAFPERFVDAYIAEQNMIGMATGLQARGKIPFVSTFACFLTRAFDVIRMAGISRANLKLCGSHAGVSVGQDGPSQMGLEDLAMMRAVPGAVVLYPADAVAAERMVVLAARHDGIVYLRTTRPETPVLYPARARFAIGGSVVLRATSRDRLTVVAAGITVHEALQAWARLRDENVMVRVLDLYSVAPVDRGALLAAAAETHGILLTVEDHYPAGGIGEAVCGAVAPAGVQVRRLAVRELPRSGDGRALLDAYGIGANAIVQAVHALL
jgi:transketolase